jgi:two-component system, chemotaxis family, response regulator Rcp1
MTQLRVLYIEDSPADAEFVRAAFRRSAPEVGMTVASGGSKALAILSQGAEDGTLPDLVLLDLKMPGMDGHEVLASIKSSPRLRHIPTIVLTSSRLEEDISRAYDIGANCYLPKPEDALGYAVIAVELKRFWMDMALLPRGATP